MKNSIKLFFLLFVGLFVIIYTKNYIQAGVIDTIKDKTSSAYNSAKDFVTGVPRVISNMLRADEYCNLPASVRQNTDLSEEEKQFILKRDSKIKASLHKRFATTTSAPGALKGALLKRTQTNSTQTTIKPVIKKRSIASPRIALCFSGGGFRAMVESLGFLEGAQETGLLDQATYMTGLSGSTWTIIPWIASGVSLSDYKQKLKAKINKKAILDYATQASSQALENMATTLIKKYYDGQSLGATDLYGALLASVLFEDKQQTHSLATLAHKCQTGDYPLPICTAISDYQGKHDVWFEFTPFEIGSAQLNAFIPSWALGRSFNAGTASAIGFRPNVSSIIRKIHDKTGTYTRALSMGYLLGIFGSAYAVNAANVFAVLKGKLLPLMPKGLQEQVTNIKYDATVFNKLPAGSARRTATENFGAAWMPNFTYGLSGVLSQKKDFSLVDGGYDLVDEKYRLNLAVIPLLRPERKVKVIIMCDSSGDLVGGDALRAAQVRARALSLPFPVITDEMLASVHTRLLTVFNDPKDSGYNRAIPTIVYLPAVKNSSYKQDFDPTNVAYTSTPNFCYTPEQVDELSGLLRFTVVQLKQEIMRVIDDVAKNNPE